MGLADRVLGPDLRRPALDNQLTAQQKTAALQDFDQAHVRFGFKTGKAHIEQMLSALPPIATAQRTSLDVR